MKSNLKQILKNKGVTVTDLSKNTGISRSLLSELANNQDVPGKTRIDVLGKIASFLDCNIRDIIRPDISNLALTKLKIKHTEIHPDNSEKGSIEITDIFFCLFKLSIENNSLTIPLVTVTFFEPEIHLASDPEKKDLAFSFGSVDILNYADLNLLKSKLPYIYEKIPTNYDPEKVFQKLESIKFAGKKLSLFLIEQGAILLKKDPLNTIMPTTITWGSRSNTGDIFSYVVSVDESNNWHLETEYNPFPHDGVSQIVEYFEKKR